MYGRAQEHLERHLHGLVSVCLQYVRCKDLLPALGALAGAVCLTSLSLGHNDISSVVQLNMLGTLCGIPEVSVTDNAVCTSKLMRPFILFRMGSKLKVVNDLEVAESERVEAAALFSPLIMGIAKQLNSVGSDRVARLTAQHHYHTFPGMLSSLSRPPGRTPRQVQEGNAGAAASSIVGDWLEEACAVNEAIEGLHGAWTDVLHQLIDQTLSEIEDIEGGWAACS
mmetsp:Transcript_13111/g.32129  ORF Transcript_13111/g.32129 Transcript_13111/m.32129 type:complete len:225 (+) Transcript_13111:112-786(+)